MSVPLMRAYIIDENLYSGHISFDPAIPFSSPRSPLGCSTPSNIRKTVIGNESLRRVSKERFTHFMFPNRNLECSLHFKN